MEEFDFIIVGAGAGGCVVAEKLSRKWKVLLLEAGGDDNNPIVHNHNDWWVCCTTEGLMYPQATVPQQHLPENRTLNVTMGKLLGGSTSHNAQMYVRGNSSDYELWESKFGMTGWNWKRALEAFKVIENTQHIDSLSAPEIHGKDGFMPIMQGKSSDFTSQLQDAITSAGIPNVDDYCEQPLGGSKVWSNVIQSENKDDLQRISAYQAFLHNTRDERKDLLTIETHALVSKVLFNEDKQAIGVEYISTKGTKEVVVKVAAKKEVILCAGAVKSPQLLMLSGVGDKEHLAAMGVDIVHHNSAVGSNLEDHAFCCSFYEAKESLPEGKHDTWSTYQILGRNDNNYDAVRSSNIEESAKKDDRADFQIVWAANSVGIRGFPLGFPPRESAQQDKVVLVCVCQLHPNCDNGKIRLTSSDPRVDPKIDLNYLSNEEDLKTWENAFTIANNITLSKEMTEKWIKESFQDLSTPSKIREHISTFGGSMFHPVGTCRAGTSTENTVLDVECNVRGVSKLRVIDASVIPQLTSGNTMAPSLVVAEIGSQFVFDKYNV